MNTIAMETAARLWNAHREIQVATKLLTDLREALKHGENPTPRDVFGRPQNYSLGVPSGQDAQRLYDVSPTLAVYIIEAHIGAQQKELVEASVQARMELDGTLSKGG